MILNLLMAGIIIFVIGFITWAYDQPKIDLLSQGMAQLALLNKQVRDQFMEMQTEIFYSKLAMLAGGGMIITGIFVKRKTVTT